MKSKNIIITLSFSIITLCLFSGDSVSAVSYQHSVGLNFTFNSSLSISVSDDLLVDNLTPGDSSDSNIITVGVDTNAVAGYILSSTVGTKTGASTALTNTASSSYKFTNLATTPGIATSLSAFSDNTWGYSYCPDTETNCSSSGSATWISGSIGENGAAGSSVAGYAGLPLDNNDDTSELGNGGVTLINTTDPSISLNSVQFKIGARASSTQPTGTYTNTINFYAVSYAAPVTLYEAYTNAGKTMLNGYYKLQDMNPSICSAVTALETPLDVVDVRDGEIYKISKLADERCWLLDNLRLDLTDTTVIDTLSSTNTNASDTILGYLKNGGGTGTDQYPPTGLTGSEWNSNSSYYAPQVAARFKNDTATSYGLGSGKVGVYYNYCAASAGSYCYGGDRGIDTESTNYDIGGDICSTSWHIPTTQEYNRLASNGYHYRQDAANPNSIQYNLSTPLSGYYIGDGQNNLNSFGFFWSSTWSSEQRMRTLRVNSSSVQPSYDANLSYRHYGGPIRCIADN